MPERTWRRHQARARAGHPLKGPWPRPARSRVRDAVRAHALAHPAWGHRKGLGDGPLRRAPRLGGDRAAPAARRGAAPGGQLPARTPRAGRQPPGGVRDGADRPDTCVWQLDFSEFETTGGGTWRVAGCRDYWSKYEHRFHISPTANQHDAIAAVELALAEAAELTGRPLRDLAEVDADGNVQPVVTIVTDNGGPFRSFTFEAFITTHPELRHVRTRVKTPGQNGSRERGFGSLKYERLFLEEIPDAIDLAAHAEDYRVEYNTVRPHEAIAWNHPIDVHLGHADPATPNFPEPQNLPST